MSNFDETSQAAIAEFVVGNLGRHKQFALATLEADGRPWVVCLNLSFDKSLKIIWKSQMDTEHSRNIARDARVGVCIFSETPEVGDFGYYARGEAHVVTDLAELAHCLKVRYGRNGKVVPETSEFLDSAPIRIYCAEVSEAWVNDDRHLKVPVDLAVLREKLAQ